MVSAGSDIGIGCLLGVVLALAKLKIGHVKSHK